MVLINMSRVIKGCTIGLSSDNLAQT